MKTIKIKTVIITLATIVISLGASAQMPTFDVNGLNVDEGQYTKAQVVAKLGEPISYRIYDRGAGSMSEKYQYQNSKFNFDDDGVFKSFSIGDPQFKFLGGMVKVGDLITNLSTIPGCRFSLKSQYDLNDPMMSDLWVGQMEKPVFIFHKNGLITRIYYSTPL